MVAVSIVHDIPRLQLRSLHRRDRHSARVPEPFQRTDGLGLVMGRVRVSTIDHLFCGRIYPLQRQVDCSRTIPSLVCIV
jgi:hypothetical protein